jgi:hypothetical protein
MRLEDAARSRLRRMKRFLIHWSLCGMYIDIILIAMGKGKNKTKHRILPKDITDYLKIMATIPNMTLIIFL